MTEIPPVHREVVVDADPAAAFEVFTGQLGSWWPLAELSVHGAESTVAFEDGQIVERGPDGATAIWGTVTEWTPPQAVAFTWHPGKDAAQASAVSVTFNERGDRTLVVLEHSGWEIFSDPAAAKAEYDHGWPMVLERFGAYTSEKQTWTWLALLHTPGPSAPEDKDDLRG